MKIYDISQELLTCTVYPGDPTPSAKKLSSISNGALYNLTYFEMCAHNGTHIDAPNHFYDNGKTVDQIDLGRFIGPAFVAEHDGIVTSEDASRIINKARSLHDSAAKRILLKGSAVVSGEAAEVFAEEKIVLIGNESQTVGPEDSPMAVHLKLLGAGIVLLEGIRLTEVPEGIYLLNAAPINISGADGAPVRAVLIDPETEVPW